MRRRDLNISKLGGRILEMRVLPPFVLPEIVNGLARFSCRMCGIFLQIAYSFDWLVDSVYNIKKNGKIILDDQWK